ncbi:MAG: GNAT family N-acetyltransferase [Chitinivibrionales bacterium]|nr:GNAT family N-acetyltransferase [Chitinivibrionales bacterium]
MPDREILAAQIEDAAEILALQKLAYRRPAELHNDLTIVPMVQSLDEMEDDLRSQAVFKVVEEGAIIGSVRAYVVNGVCCIGRLIVHPDFQRRGIGTDLMRAIEARFRSADCFELFTGPKSIDAVRLYEKLGYQRCDRHLTEGDVELVFLRKFSAKRDGR